MLGTHKQVMRIKGFIREGSDGATHELHRTDRKGLVEELLSAAAAGQDF